MRKTGIRQLCRRGLRPLRVTSPVSIESSHCTCVSRVTRDAAASVEPAAGACLSAPLISSVVVTPLQTPLLCSRRFFWNPFVSNTTGTASATRDSDEKHAKMLKKAHRDADLENEQLLSACLDLLKVCSGNAVGSATSNMLDRPACDCIWALVDVFLHDHRRVPAEQFSLVYTALCLPAAQEHRQVQRSLLVILRSVIPETLYRVFESVNLFVLHDDEPSRCQRDTLMKFMRAQLGDLHVPDGLAEEEVLSVYVEDMKAMFPSLVTCPAWHAVERDAVTIALKAKLFAVLSRLCAELDEGRTGKIKLVDLRLTAERVLGEDQAALLLEGAQADQNGSIAYPHLVALLTRPPPKELTHAKFK
ncbi:hypothetical protein JKF63_05595 [Porcisia hertigi]|uniref:Uncharacterized protein n=1 Tax=Porcisia hertigi TaxID=2761500 RepID=A0A836IQQ1_9TRYP|nr:hypothetical protein JKF63_05595 [Porcisia hertigi]